MTDSPNIQEYEIRINWDGRAGYFVAEIPEIPTCAADGSTPSEALSELEKTFAVLVEAYAEERLAFPAGVRADGPSSTAIAR